ncbi:glycosyltransferase [Puteibacter caeruleilacunae]|nr:glycosyltransferase [Puteibacter caeruleilacunae]
MKLLQINTLANQGSVGRIAEDLGVVAKQHGYNSYFGCSTIGANGSSSDIIKIGTPIDVKLHGLKTRIFDLHGFGSKGATKQFVRTVKEINPDIIHLHNVHGYYLNIEELFHYIKTANKPVVWTFHDCWSFTGHCSYFDFVNCYKWKDQCQQCPNKKGYPGSWWRDNSRNNFIRKRELFTGVKNMRIVTPSHWLKQLVEESFLKDYQVEVIHNGIDLERFNIADDTTLREKYNLNNQKILLGVASTWDRRKGLADFEKLSQLISNDYSIVLVGLNESQIETLPEDIIGIARTENVDELAGLYALADVFLNPTDVDNFPTTNIEALACGTPVVTYNTGGSPEAVDQNTGIVVEKGNVQGLWEAIQKLGNENKTYYQNVCRQRAEEMFNKQDRYHDYVELYENVLQKNKI